MPVVEEFLNKFFRRGLGREGKCGVGVRQLVIFFTIVGLFVEWKDFIEVDGHIL